ncbi:MAG: AMP-binding protein [Pseudonocardia sp.]|nr:AMP-binding protein [Pseudonocardia sp.]
MRSETYWELVERRARTSPDALALVDENGARLTFADLRERAEATATGLAARGVGQGSRVAWQLPNRVSTVLVMLALTRLGAFQMPLLIMYRERELGALLAAGRPDLVLVPGVWRGTDHESLVRAVLAANGLGHVPTAVPDNGTAAGPGAPDLPPPPSDPDRVTWAYPTSGTTGAPRAAQHTDRGVIAAATGFAEGSTAGARPDDVGCIAFPIAHLGGSQYLAISLLTGTPTVLVEAFDPPRTLATFRDHGVSIVGGSTALYQAVLEEHRRSGTHPLPTLRLFGGGGAPLPSRLYHALRSELGARIAHSYGMTEVLMVAVADVRDDDAVLAATDGRLLPHLDARVVGSDGEVLPPGAQGELQLRGISVTTGYTDPTHDTAAFTADGWLRTGDVVRLAPSGHVTVTGRIKDVIIRKGETLSAVEIEGLLRELPAVAEAAVVGLPDATRGELVCAVVRPADPARPPGLAEIAADLRAAGLMVQKLPERLETVDAMPRTGLGKIAKAELRTRFAVPAGEPV